MRSYFTVACLSLSLLSSVSFSVAARKAQAADPPKISEETLAASRAFVRIWQKPGIFEDIKFGAVVGQTLYLGGAPRGLEAVDLQTGTPQWVHPGVMQADFPPVESYKLLYLVEGGRLVTIDPANGVEKSRAKPRPGFMTPAYPMEKYCIFAAPDEYVYAVLTDIGAKSWKAPLNGIPIASAWDGGILCFFTTSKGALVAVNMEGLQTVWTHDFSKPGTSVPAVSGKMVYIGSEDFYLYALDTLIGEVQWKTTLSAPVLEMPVVVGSRVYVGTTEKLIHAVDINTHNDLWTVPGNRVLTTTPEHVIFLRKDKDSNVIGMADAATGKVISEMNASQYVQFAGPAEGGIVYAIGKKGDVLAFGDRATVEAREATRQAKKAAELMPKEAPPAPPAPAAPSAPATTATPATTAPPPAAPKP